MSTLAIELAGTTWLVEGLHETFLGRLAQARVTGSGTDTPHGLSWTWVDHPGDRMFLQLESEFDMDFEYGREVVLASGPLFNARIVLEPDLRAEVEVLRSGEPIAAGILENVLRILMAYRTAASGGILLHSACFANTSQAWLVFGHSGAGKSTCSEFAAGAGFRVLSDDMNVVRPVRQGWEVCRVPFSGTFQAAYDGPATLPLEAVCRLRQSVEHRIEPLSPAIGVAALVASASFINEDPWRAVGLIGNCERLASEVAVRELHFRRDPEFLQLLVGKNHARAVA